MAQAIVTKALLASALAVAVSASDDDLAVVKRAVSQRISMPDAARPGAVAERPQWLRVRIVEKASKHSRVSVNLPLAIVRLLGEGCPVIDWHCRAEGGRCSVKVAEVLHALESGERQLVEIESDEASVRVWVE